MTEEELSFIERKWVSCKVSGSLPRARLKPPSTSFLEKLKEKFYEWRKVERGRHRGVQRAEGGSPRGAPARAGGLARVD